MFTNDVSTLKINKLTQEQYDRELAAGNIKEDELYITPSVISEFEDMVTNELENLSDRTSQISNENLVPNILPLAADLNKNVSVNPTTLASVDMLQFGNAKWNLKMSGVQTSWSVYIGDIGDGTDDENFGGVCKRYIGYEKPAGSGHQCYGLFCKISAYNKTVFKAGDYTLSFWACVEGTSTNLCPHITTSEPTKALGGNVGGVTIGKWQKFVKTVNIPTDTDSIYVILDSFAPNQTTHRKLRCADIKLEYGSVATRFVPDNLTEFMQKKIESLNTEIESLNTEIESMQERILALEEAAKA